MMKPPEEIKKGLEEVAKKGSTAFWALETAPYKNIIGDILLAGDALAYIQQLESRLAQVERERDAMHRDMKLYSRCKACKRFVDGLDCPVHTECTYGGKGLFEWRGVCAEDTEEN